MTMHARHAGRGWLTLVTLCALLLAPGCSSRARSAEDVRRDYALKLLEGITVGYFDIRAERADPETFTLFDLTMRSGDTLIHADRAVILVDADRRSVSLRLSGVVGADAQSGVIVSLDDLESSSFKLSHAVRE